MKSSHFLTVFCSLISLPIFLEFSNALDNISSIQSIKDGSSTSTLLSTRQIFELGFFSPVNSKNRYIGIWYKITPDAVVWVANRNNPLHDSFGELTIDNKGNLVLLNRAKSVIWSSNSSNSSRVTKHPVAQLLDTGNLVLGESESISSESYLWQSFDHPSDTHLQYMKLGWDLRSGLERYLVSWKGVGDPSDGNYTLRLDIRGLPQIIMAEGSTRKVRIGPWNGVEFSGFTMSTNSIYERKFVYNKEEASYSFVPITDSVITRVTVTSAKTDRLMLQSGNEWKVLYTLPEDPCDSYAYCRANSICSVSKDPICQCLEGFTPSSQEEWEVLNWSKGCVRKTPLDCDVGDQFVPCDGVKLPDLLQFWLNKSISLDECKTECLKNCSCTAYANSDVTKGGSGCVIWFGELIDIRELKGKGSKQDLYVRVSASEIKSTRSERNRKRRKIKLAATMSSGVCVSILLLCCITWKLRKMAIGKSKDDDIELPLFDLATIRSATNNFSPSSIVGEGGFGPVYKGNFLSGQEIAVKRLSKNSRQGPIEFKNEVELIAKLQHKNLVALLGCCIQGDERMIIYEYMTNKSLDRYIFDKKGSNLSSWKSNFEILMGVARGLLYLHQDSKLPIIHRDLKAGNVLLDSNMNPKISDFGLARIFGGDDKENQTNTIVGTYGYISPEFAVDGIFSVKSDVFSFGVLSLEIVSGKRNRKFNHRDHHHNLLGHAWLLWNRGEALELMDACFKDSGVESQVLRCIHVGLLCVQKHAEDRPTMNSIILMLSNEGVKLPQPKEPGFFVERSSNKCNKSSTSRTEEFHSENAVTISLDGR